jgi:hypothetical protein
VCVISTCGLGGVVVGPHCVPCIIFTHESVVGCLWCVRILAEHVLKSLRQSVYMKQLENG